MYKLVLLVRKLRDVTLFKLSARVIVVVLMVVGGWVATRTLDVPVLDVVNDKIIHIVVFFGFALLVDMSTSRRPFWLWKGIPLTVYGILIEILQYYSPDRFFSLLDWLADIIGITLYFLIKILVRKLFDSDKSDTKY